MLKGVNIPATVHLARRSRIPVIASGGVADLGDILALARESSEGIEGVITGRALYDGRLKLKDAIAVAGTVAGLPTFCGVVSNAGKASFKGLEFEGRATEIGRAHV